MKIQKVNIVFMLLLLVFFISASTDIVLHNVINGNISPKSVVYSGNGLFFAQNMMYRHTVTVYNREYQLLKTIQDKIKLSDYGYSQYQGYYKGAPVEAAFSHNGNYAWISNYIMEGAGFNNPGHDKGGPTGKFDKSFVYRINTETFAIENVIPVGAVPKYVAVTPDNKYVLVTNWCTWDVTIIDTETNQPIKTVYIGRYPRGIAVSPDSKTVYIAVMGTYDVAVLNLENFTLSTIKDVGRSPRHVNIDQTGKYIYVTCNGEGAVAKIDTETKKVVKKVSTGNAPRSSVLNQNGSFLYVVNYSSNTMSKVDTNTMTVVKTVNTNHHPIGITYDPEKKQVWVCCYSGTIMIFQD